MTTNKPSPSETDAKPTSKWVENLQIVGFALVLAIFIRTFIAEPRFIPSESMLPTLHVGDRLVVEKISYNFHPPEYGDIVVFSPPPQLVAIGYGKDRATIKRTIGLPGDTIAVTGGKVYRNGELLTESYIQSPPNYDLEPVTVPPTQMFVMGDNRNNSYDSHMWGFLPQKNIIGKAIWRFFPFARLSFKI
jgi:signal peptidase I